MEVLYLIVLNVILPVFTLIGLGVFLHRKFSFDLNTLSKISTFLLLPAVSFVNIYQSSISGDVLFTVMGFLLLQNLCLMIICSGTSKVLGFDRGISATFKNSVVLKNSGNFGIPVSQLVFQANPLGLSIQVIVLIFQNLLTYTYGLMNSVGVKTNGWQALQEFLKIPILYALIIGLLLNHLEVPIPFFIWKPIETISNSFLAIALITLGAQSAFLKISKFSLPLTLSLFGRLILSPILAFAIITLLKLDGTTAQALLIASSFPSSRNSALFALEYDNHPVYAAQAVILSTLFSCVTVTGVVYLSGMLYG